MIVNDECKKILGLAGLKDVYSKSKGQTCTKLNFMKACFFALKQLSKIKVRAASAKKVGLIGAGNE